MATTYPPKTFPLFPTLPTELRLRIWHFISPGPRTISIQYKTKYNTFNGKTISTFTGWLSPDAPPIILSISQESRAFALKSYVPSFGSYFHQARIYVDYSIDTLRFGNGPGEAYLKDPSWFHAGPSEYPLDIFLGGGYHGGDDEEKIRYMVIDVSEALYDRREFCWGEIRLFTGLKELTIMPWEEDDKAAELMRFYRDTFGTVTRNYPEWTVPEIMVLSALTGKVWGSVRAGT